MSSFLLLALTLSCSAATGKSPDLPRPRHIFLISIDTLRADHCSFLGYSKPTTPFLERIAGRSVVFTNHHANSSNTLLSHASILTGLLPQAHGAYDDGEDRHALEPGYRTMPEALLENGYSTAAFTSHPIWLGRDFGLDQGFQHVESDWYDATSLTTAFLKWFDNTRPASSSVFLHYYDVHSRGNVRLNPMPYGSTPDYEELFAGPKPHGFTCRSKTAPDVSGSVFLSAVDEGTEALSAEEVAYLAGLYDAGIRQLDDHLSELFVEIGARIDLDDALVVITSDHGEEFQEHGGMLHGGYHEEVRHVPLLVLCPSDWKVEPRRIEHLTSSVDLAATILTALGLAPIGQGRSLVPLFFAQGIAAAPVVFEARYHSASVRTDILVSRDDSGTFSYGPGVQPPFFYDLDRDPRETRNLLQGQRSVSLGASRLAKLDQALASLALQNAAYAASVQARSPERPPLSSEDHRALNALGYHGR